jgi:hypothetical protein
LFVRIEINENTEETVRNNATMEVSSSTRLFSDLLVKCNEVIIIRQKPKRFAEVPNIWIEVLVAILYCLAIYFSFA